MESTPDTQPTQPQPPDEPKRLLRSSDDRMIAGVCGGIARYLGVDATLVRLAAVVLAFIGGAGVLGYVAALLLMPSDSAPAAGKQSGGTMRTVGVVILLLLAGGLIAAGLSILLPFALLALAGLATWWLVSGEGPGGDGKEVARRAMLGIGVLVACCLVAVGGAVAAGLGGGTVVAALVIAAGVMLVAGAFMGGARWLIPPALSLALAVGFVSAAGIEFEGGAGEKDYRPTSAGQVRGHYELGLGELTVDLRDADLPAGDTPLDLDVGIGEARVIVPEDVCVASTADMGAGAVILFGREKGGVDFDWDDRPRGEKRLVVDADVGVGVLNVRHDDDNDDGGDGIGNAGCRETRAAR